MSRRWVGAVGLLVYVSSAVGCDDTIVGIDEPADASSCRRSPPLDYEDFGRSFLGKHCTGCHSADLREGQRNLAPVDVNLDSWEDVKLWADRIEATAVASAAMPPGGGTTQEEREKLGEWLRCDVYPSISREGGGGGGS